MTQKEEMPKEIWALHYEATTGHGEWEDYPSEMATKYIRADLVPHWRPIETAPKDGSYILLYRPIEDHRQRRSVQEGKFHRYGMKKTWRVMSGGVWDIDAPTHWMPLPKLPALKENEK